MEEIAVEESKKRVMRKTKKELLDEIGKTMAFIIKYIDIKDRFDSMRAAVDIFRDENVAILGVIKSINDKYNELFDRNGKIDRWHKENKFADFINYDKVEDYRHFGGIRNEEDYLITETGARRLGKKIPLTPEEVEELR